MIKRRELFKALAATPMAAKAAIGSVVTHKLLRRPYRDGFQVEPHARKLFAGLHLRMECAAPVRIRVCHPERSSEPLMEVTVTPRSGEWFSLMGVHGARAEWITRVETASVKPVKIIEHRISMMNPPFRVIDGQIVYHDPFYQSQPESSSVVLAGEATRRTKRGLDVWYGGGKRA